MSASLTYVSHTHIASNGRPTYLLTPLQARRRREGEAKMRMQRSYARPRTNGWTRIIGVFGVLAVAASSAGCKSEAVEKVEAPRPVKVAIVEAAPSQRTLTYSGVVRPRVEATLGFRVPGKIIARSVNVGDRIELGKIIAGLIPADLK